MKKHQNYTKIAIILGRLRQKINKKNIVEKITKQEKLTLHSEADLVGHMSHLANRVGQVVVFLEEVKGAEC